MNRLSVGFPGFLARLVLLVLGGTVPSQGLQPVTTCRPARHQYPVPYAAEVFFLVERRWALQWVYLDRDGDGLLETLLILCPDGSVDGVTYGRKDAIPYDPGSDRMPEAFQGIHLELTPELQKALDSPAIREARAMLKKAVAARAKAGPG